MIDIRLAPQAAASPGAADTAAGTGETSPGTAGRASTAIDFLAVLAGLADRLLPGTAPPQATQTDAAGPAEGELQQDPAADAGGTTGTGTPLTALLEMLGAHGAFIRTHGCCCARAGGPDAPPAAGTAPAAAEGPWHGLAAAAMWAPPRTDDARGEAGHGAGAACVRFTLTLPVLTAAPVAEAPAAGVPVPAAPAPATPAPPATDPDAAGAAAAPTPAVTTAPAAGTEPDAAATTPPAGTAAAGTAPAAATTQQATSSPPAADDAPAQAPAAVTPPATPATPATPAPAGGAHGARELAQEIEIRLRVAVRDHGRVLKLSIKPPELGQLHITVVRHEGALQAQIVAERPEAVRLLERALPHLQDMLADRGMEMGAFDVTYREQDARGAAAEARHDHHGRGRHEGDEAAPAPADGAEGVSGAGAGHDGVIDALA